MYERDNGKTWACGGVCRRILGLYRDKAKENSMETTIVYWGPCWFRSYDAFFGHHRITPMFSIESMQGDPGTLARAKL